MKSKIRVAAGVILAILVTYPGLAWAQEVYTGTPVPVVGTSDTGVAVLSSSGQRVASADSEVAVLSAAQTRSGGTSRLAMTGADILLTLSVALALLVTGMVLVRRARSRTAA